MDVERLIKLGGQLSLKGNELKVWVDRQLAEEAKKKEVDRKLAIEDKEREAAMKEREAAVREREREAIRADKEREAAVREREREAIRADKEREAVIREREAELKERERESHALILERQLELERMKSENPTTEIRQPSHSVSAKSPRLPPFNDAKGDCMNSYILRFERYATANRWNKTDWSLHLSALLTGKALEVYTRMDIETASDYDQLRDALLTRYNLTEDGFAAKFRNSRPEHGERMVQFKTRLATYLDNWMELAGRDKTNPTDVLDLILKEQLMGSFSKELRTFIKERKPRTAEEVVQLADNFIEAHGSSGAFSRHQGSQSLGEKDHHARQGRDNMRHGNDMQKAVSPQGKSRCYKCSGFNHLARDCKATMYKLPGRQVSVIRADVSCTYCNRRGHNFDRCWQKMRDEKASHEEKHQTVPETKNQCVEHKKMELKCGCALPVVSTCLTNEHESSKMPVAAGLLNGQAVTVLRDSGCSCVVIRKGLLPERQTKDEKVLVHLANGTTVSTPLVEIELDSPYYKGTVVAAEMETPLYDVIVGNIPGAKCPGIDVKVPQELLAVETRSTRNKKFKTLLTPRASDTEITVKEIIEKQMEDASIAQCRKMAETGQVRQTGRSNKTWYGHEQGVLFRYFIAEKLDNGDLSKQVVVPRELRQTVMKIAHESILAGHLAAKKTTERILQDFFWPNIWGDVSRYCQSCDQCQRSAPKGKTPKNPLSEVPLIDDPFKRIAVDIVGPILPASDRGYKYILTVVDYCTRYPEAVPLKSIETESVAEALVDIYSRVGIPREVLSDRGSQFISDLMKEVCRLLSIRQLTTTAYHPQCNGLVERFNATLKGMLKRLATERPKDWDRYINAALFAYREVPQESLGFSPFEMLYARPVRGPMTILRELWTNEIRDEEIKSTYQYVVDLREKMEKVIELAHENLKTSSTRYKAHFDTKAKQRTFNNGDKVLLLLPTKHNKLQLKWQGPFDVIKRTGTNNYAINLGTSQKTYHANLLKKYYERECPEQASGILQCAVAAVIHDEEEYESSSGPNIELPTMTQSETFKDTCINMALDEQQKRQINKLLGNYQDVMTDVPGRTTLCAYELKLTSDAPIRKKPYPVPHAMKDTLRDEVKTMLDAGIIEPSDSSYCSPSVVVKKKDGTNRYCIDYRALNNVTRFDAEPMPNLDDLFGQIGPESNFLSKIDLSKGYWQIPLTPASRPMTAFATELGLMQFKVLPFGLQCAPAAFSRLMRKVLSGLQNVKNYIDDILIHHATWEDHIKCIEDVLNRLRQAGLTARPTKCFLGCTEIEFLGHKVGNGNIAPTTDKIKAIKDAEPPQTKKQVRSFLGLVSFYRRYIPNFSAIVCPLTDATKKGMPNRIVWEEPQQRAFDYVKRVLTSEPVLRLPNFTEPFILSTDASDTGVGAILTQESEGEKFPVVYLSRKLLPREQRYSVVERECLALVWAIQKLSTYLIGREFILETDHTPLLYLNKAKSENGRLMRWALLLSQYRFTIKAVKGTDNHGPDFLSRLV